MRYLLLLLFFTGACATGTGPRTPPAEPAAGGGAAFLALGDSYTIGEGVAAADRWLVQLAALAREQGLALSAPALIARTGWTTAELQAAIQASGNANSYRVVSLLIGVNNQYRGQSPRSYRPEFRQLLGTAVRFAGGQAGHVLVLAIPDWGQAPAGRRHREQIGREIDQFNAVARDECQRAGIAFVDITPLTRAAAGQRRQFAGDGLHYSGRQVRQWAQLALPVVREMLR